MPYAHRNRHLFTTTVELGLGIEGRKTVVSSFRSEMTAKEIESVYKQVVRNRK